MLQEERNEHGAFPATSLLSRTQAPDQAISRWHGRFYNKGRATRHTHGIIGARCGHSRWYSEKFWRSGVILLDLLCAALSSSGRRAGRFVSLFIDGITK